VRRNDYEAGIELVATCREVGHVPHVFENSWACGARLGWLYGPAHVVDAINRIRGPFNVNAAAMAAGKPRSGRRNVEASRAHNEKWPGLAHGRNPQARAGGDAQHRQLRVIHFPETRAVRRRTPTAFLTRRGLILRRSSLQIAMPCA